MPRYITTRDDLALLLAVTNKDWTSKNQDEDLAHKDMDKRTSTDHISKDKNKFNLSEVYCLRSTVRNASRK